MHKRRSIVKKVGEDGKDGKENLMDNVDEIINRIEKMKKDSNLNNTPSSVVSISDICNYLVDIIMKEPKIKCLIMGPDDVLLKAVE